jgi:hypothetical protein
MLAISKGIFHDCILLLRLTLVQMLHPEFLNAGMKFSLLFLTLF